jgi:hypothetical protein
VDKNLDEGLYITYWVRGSAGFSDGGIQNEFRTFIRK